MNVEPGAPERMDTILQAGAAMLLSTGETFAPPVKSIAGSSVLSVPAAYRQTLFRTPRPR